MSQLIPGTEVRVPAATWEWDKTRILASACLHLPRRANER
jgi:hypothetical protein